MEKKSLNIHIDRATIFFIIAVGLGLKFLQLTADILLILFISYLISVAVNPFVNFLKIKLRIPRGLSTAIILLTILLFLVTAIGSMIPPLLTETTNFFEQLPSIVAKLGVYNIDVSTLTGSLSSLPANVLRVALDTFSAVLFLSTTFVLSFYLVRERPNLEHYLKLFFDHARAESLTQTIYEIESKLGYWVRGEIFLMVCIGVLSFIGFSLIGLDYALPLALIAGLLELVPNLGPTLATIPAAIVGFSMSPLHGLLVILVSITVQQLENNLIVPAIMRKAIGLHPLVTIVSLLIGFRLGGTMLAILALPLVLTIQAVLKHNFANSFPKNSPITA